MAANNRLIFGGLAELRAELRRLPSELTGEASHIVEATANAAAVEVRSEYAAHNQTGNLQRGVVISRVDQGKYSAGAIVKSTAPHATLFENGSQARHTDLGYNRGAMPPAHIFVNVVMRHRRGMWERLKAMLERHGLLVSGEAG